MPGSIIQITPPVRDISRAHLAKTLKNDDCAAKIIEECVWQWSQLVATTSTFQQPEKSDTQSVDLKVRTDDANQLYESKILQLMHNLNLNGKYLKTINVKELMWFDDSALAHGTEFQYLTREASRHIQHLNTIVEDSREHTSINPQVSVDTTFLRCRKCHSTNVVFNQKQTRAGDEGMTAFCNCQDCGAKWKM